MRTQVRKLRGVLSTIVKGLVDSDDGVSPEEGIVILERYSIENYIYDPLYVFALLADSGDVDINGGLSSPIARGQGRDVGNLGNADLQRALNNVLQLVAGQVQPGILAAATGSVSVEYHRSPASGAPSTITVEVPACFQPTS